MSWKSITCADAAPRHASDRHVIRVAAAYMFRSVAIAAGRVPVFKRASFARPPQTHVFITDHVVGHILIHTTHEPGPLSNRGKIGPAQVFPGC
jgi:hypothetical protein